MTEEAEDPGAASDATVDLDLESDDDDAATVELNSPASAHGVQVQVVARPSVVVPPPVPPRLGTRDHSAKSSPYWQRLRPVDHLSLSPRSGSWTEFEGGKQSSTPAAPDSPIRYQRRRRSFSLDDGPMDGAEIDEREKSHWEEALEVYPALANLGLSPQVTQLLQDRRRDLEHSVSRIRAHDEKEEERPFVKEAQAVRAVDEGEREVEEREDVHA